MEDARRQHVVDIIATAIAPLGKKDAILQTLSADNGGAIRAFLDGADVGVLQASVSNAGGSQPTIRLSNSADAPAGAAAASAQNQVVVLTKLRPGPLSPADLPAGIAVATVSASPLSSLYHSLRDVYSPMLGVDQAATVAAGGCKAPPAGAKGGAATAVPPRLQELIAQVQAGLATAARQGGGPSPAVDPNSAPLTDVLTPLDEVSYWSEMAASPAAMGTPLQRAAQQVAAHMEALRQPFAQLQSPETAAAAAAAARDDDRDAGSGGDGGASSSSSWEVAKEAGDVVLAALRDVWTIPGPGAGGWAMGQRRAEHFLRVVGAAFAGHLQSRLRAVGDLWTTPFHRLKPELIGASQSLMRWATESRSLTQDWAMGLDTAGHAWSGQPFLDPYVFAVQERVDEVYRIREAVQELAGLAGQDEGAFAAGSGVFGSFAQVAALQVSDFTAPAWRAAREEYERKMAPLEQSVSNRLRDLFVSVILPSLVAAVTGKAATAAPGAAAAASASGASTVQPLQVLSELRKYAGLLSRPTIAAALRQEREMLARHVDSYIGRLQEEFDRLRDTRGGGKRQGGGSGTADAASGGRSGASPVCDTIMWAMQCELKVSRVAEVLSLVAGPSATSSGTGTGGGGGGAAASDSATAALRNVASVASDLAKELAEFKKQRYADWEADVGERLADMAGWKNSKLMTFDSANAHVKTYFNDTLVGLLREVRSLQGLGFAVKKDVLLEVDVANKFYRYGLVLKQRANFYNNISTEMIPCQKPLMLQDALDFERVLSNPRDAQGKDITWRNVAALDGYVRRLNDVADRLAERNRQLRKWHGVLCDKVVGLMHTDLVRSKDKWAAGVKEMRDVFGRLEAEGYSRESQQVWRQHWDFQLYKALEVQYVGGLANINRTLPEMEVKLVFRQGRLQYDPPLEELRIRHYKDCLNTFLGLPLRMKGVSDLSERPGFFRPIADANPGAAAKVYAAAEALFGQMEAELKKYQDLIVLGQPISVAMQVKNDEGEEEVVNKVVDLDEFAESQLREVGDWEHNFKWLKAVARDLERLPHEARLDCYRVNLVPLKTSVEEHMRRLQEALVTSLRRKAIKEKQEVEEWVRRGTGLFGLKASSIEDIGNNAQAAKKLVDELMAMQRTRRRIDEKNRLLRQMAAGGGGGGTASAAAAQFAVVDMTDVNNQWEAFTAQLQQYDAHLAEQKEGLEGTVRKAVDDFRGRVAGFASRWQELKPRGGPSGNPTVVLSRIEEASAALEELKAEGAKYVKECEAFLMEAPDFSQLDEVAADVAQTRQSWDRYYEFLRERDELTNRDWLSMRDQVWRVEDFLAKYSKAIETGGATGAAGDNQEGGGKAAPAVRDAVSEGIALILLKEIDAYRRCLPFLKSCMRGAGWEDEHWLQLFGLLGMKTGGVVGAVSKETVTLAHFLDKADAILAKAEAIKALDARAQGEAVIRKALAELKLWGYTREFSFTEPPPAAAAAAAGGVKRGGVALIKEWRDIMSEVGDHQSLVASLKQSSYYSLFKDEVSAWDGKLSFLSDGLQLLNAIQRKWVYLEPIFSRGALPAQQGRFRNVDDEFRRVMASLHGSLKVVSFAEIPGISDKLPAMGQQLDVCQRALADYLEEKRSLFPRFYFIGDDDLLEILGQAKNPGVIQSHLKKLFAGIHRVRFSERSDAITAMLSLDGEVVELAGAVGVTDSIEAWLTQLSKGMKGTLAGQLAALRGKTVSSEFRTASSQALCLREALAFTAQVEQELSSGGGGGLGRLLAEWQRTLQAMASSDFTGQPLLQLKKQSLVLDYIHYLDVLQHLADERAASAGDWAWSRQLRYYQGGSGGGSGQGVAVAMAEGKFDYSWEYQGNAAKLVYTPLTDKCYLTLTQALALGYGGNPYGPAGTGKTESVKALGQALGRQVLVFNCDEEFDFRSMGRIFVGLVKCGAWGCFDEFNRLSEEVLSAVSQQIQLIQGALKEGAQQMSFMDRTVDVDRNAGIFVTLNPAGKGYGGRSKLPDNLKQLFRSIAMTVPDNELIAEVLLVSEGFAAAKELAKKLVTLFTLSRELLSPQQHYDWGLRALKTCLGVAGRELRDMRKAAGDGSNGSGAAISAKAETEIIIRSVCAIKLPTLTFEDNGRFRGLIKDLFPSASVTDTRNPELEKAIGEAAAALALELTAAQVEKMLQLHLAAEQRIGIIIVGPSGSGKSTLWEVLEKAYERLGRRHIVYKVNPKAMGRQQLLGSMNLDTREWSDGVLTAAARKVVKEPLEQRSWIVCDGDVDPEWIESLNSVLDDNRLLTMPNGERIQFANNINFIFECDGLEFASPATISRCGMLFTSDEAVDVDRMVARWLRQHAALDPGSMAAWLKDLFPGAFEAALGAAAAVGTTKVGLLQGALSQLASGTTTDKHDFAVALARGLGSNMAPDVRSDFLHVLGRLCNENGSRLLDVSSGGADPLPAVLGDMLRDAFSLTGDDEPGGLVMTADVCQNLAILAPWLKHREPILLVGPEGAGKSSLLRHVLRRLKDTLVATINCSAQTNAANVIQKLVQVCGKPSVAGSGKVLRPPEGTHLVLFLQDVNLPRPDKYRTAQLVAFLQQLVSHGGYYDEHLEFIRVERVQVVASMSPGSTVGRHPLSRRFTARTRILHVSYPPREQLHTIFAQMLTQHKWSSPAASAHALAGAMLEVYTQVLAAFTATEQPHYQFTPRHLAQWVQGLQRYSLDALEPLEAVAHEACRVFRDRLVGSEAHSRFDGILFGVLKAQLSYRPPVNGPPPSALLCSTLGATAEERLSAAAAGSDAAGAGLKLVRWSPKDFGELVADKLKAYERETKELRLELFPEVLERLARLDRALAQPGGSVLIAGPAGVGRRSCVTLVSYMHHMELVSPRMTRNYDTKAFRADLKDALRKAGVDGSPVCLLLEDYQLAGHPEFLEYVNSLLSGGEVPGLYSSEELAKELAPLESKRAADASYAGPNNSYAYFVHLVNLNLHIVLSMDPANEAFRVRCEANPALLTRCAILWLDAWSPGGMRAVAAAALKDVMAVSSTDRDDRLLDQLVEVHGTMAAQPATYDATPRHYMALVNTYKRLFGVKREQVLTQQKFLQGGLDKLAEANTTVDRLSKEAEVARVKLGQKQAEADAALQSITASMAEAADRRKEVEVLKVKLAEEEAELKEKRKDVEGELVHVQPLIDQARAAVGSIDRSNLDEIRSLKMPPDAIRDVLEGVLLVLGQEDTSWNSMKAFLGRKTVKDDIINFDAHRVTPAIRARVDKLLSTKANSFEQSVIYRASVAAAPLANWVKANLSYGRVLEKVWPLEQKLSGLKASLAESQARIGKFEAELATIDVKVQGLKQDFAARTAEAETIRLGVAKAEATLVQATTLIDRLAGEHERWLVGIGKYDEELRSLPLHTLLTAAFITYLPGHPEDVRAAAVANWVQLLGVDGGYSLQRFLSSESETLKWKAEGLPADELSVQNALVILNSPASPLIIDPSTQAAEWLKAHMRHKSVTLEVTTLGDARFTTTLELAVRFGKTLVIQEVDALPAVLYPLLRADLYRQGPRFVVGVGDKMIDYNDTFRLFLVTRNPRPVLPPDARALVAVTNFTVTRGGLEGQLLGLTLQREQPELEAQKVALLRSEEELKIQLADLEKALLQDLATSAGNLLENTTLLASLNETKAKSSTIAASLEDSKRLAASLDEQRNVYRPIAQRGSTLYFALRDLQALNNMYAFSLPVFLALFRQALASDTPPGSAVARIQLLSQALIELVFTYVSRSLFNADRLTFGVHLAKALMPALFKADEWDFFLGKVAVDTTGGAAAGGGGPMMPSWVREDAAPRYAALSAAFPSLVSAAELSDGGLWGPWVTSATAADTGVPPRVGGRLNPFQGLLLVKTFRPDRLASAMTSFITSTLSVKSVSPPPLSLRALVEGESNSGQPVLFITTPGADPSQELVELARGTIGASRYHEVAMGQGQADVALGLLRDCAKSGDWLMLKNMHLVVSWLPALEQELFMLQRHDHFRLFLTSEPHAKFPTTLLESSLKITFEAPPGLKKNLLRSYEAWSPEFLKSGPPLRAALLFVLAWFHAVVQERRSYVPQGWSKFYEFSFADLRGGADVVSLGTRDGRPLQWQYLKGLLENAIYGGRVDNPFDAKVLRLYLDQFFNPDVLGGLAAAGAKAGGGRVVPLPGTRLVVPTSGHHADYVSAIAALPDADAPSVFSLPANIDRTAQQTHSARVLGQLKAMSLSTEAAAGFDRSRWQAHLGPLIRLWGSLMSSAAPGARALCGGAAAKGAADGGKAAVAPPSSSDPITNFVALQRQHGQALVALIDRTLVGLNRVLKGTDSLTTAVAAAGTALVADQVPAEWDTMWEGPGVEGPLDYCRAVMSRANAVEAWWAKAQAGGLLTSGPLDMSHLFHPSTFLNALAQQTARATGTPLDQLKLATSWDASRMAAAAVVQLGGLYIQGAAFDGQRLSAVDADAPTSRAVPPMHLAWISKDQPVPYGPAALYTPLYVSTARSKIIQQVQLPVSSVAEAEQWTLAGTALFMSSS